MATLSSTLAWKIPWTEDPGRLQSMGSQRVGHDRATSLHFTAFSSIKSFSPLLPPHQELRSKHMIIMHSQNFRTFFVLEPPKVLSTVLLL